ncbi:alpha/beta hydrolase [Jannaschia sp. LMIT008]|uniref:alpha/beta fold hydrolase n=1 Tax=Jannaschia maritima TaxID=3032585 RepID=UPI002810C488|nr:alpha/beta hydrolase [Jannaschia sp. LMIT008]
MRGFDGFARDRIPCGDVTLSVRHNAAPDRPALMLLHGYPQTSAMWHRLVPRLAERHHVICPDLRGYGASDKPAASSDHTAMSKRAMAADVVALLDHFGHADADVCGHDRGGRVAHRLGLDHPDRVRRMAVLDIAPTREMYAGTTDAFARAYWHWFFLILPAPMPEDMIAADPRAFWTRKVAKQVGGPLPFDDAALEEYLAAFADPACIHATCEDYRAAATIDIAHDDADGGAKLTMPLLALWGDRGIVGRLFDTLALWRSRAANVTGGGLDASHYMAEEVPDQISDRLLDHFGSDAA